MAALRYALILALVLLPASPFATTFPVTKTEDTNDGTCDPDCSLREAIDAANTNPGADDVPVPAGTYLLTLGQLVVSDDLDIAGAGQTSTIIDGNVYSLHSVIEIQSSAEVEISNVTIQNGGSNNFSYYTTIRGAGIANQGDLTLTDSTVTQNWALDAAYGGYGGGIYNGSGELNLINSTVSSNTARSRGGGIYNRAGVVTLTDSTVSFDTAYVGGGIFNRDGVVALTNSTVSSNQAWSFTYLPQGILGYGGGIANSAVLTLANSTVSGNSAGVHYGVGGGILNHGTATITNSTVSDNSAAVESPYGPGGGGGISNSNVVTLTSTIVANNRVISGFDSVDNCRGSFSSLGYNLADDTTCGFSEPSDLVVADAMLGPLADNGGPTETHDLLPGSPAIDAGSVDCPPPATDQRGVARPQGTDCDIGAVEYLPEPHLAATMAAGAALLGLLYRRRTRGLRLG
jgi:CSLREA domain-containing protein